RLGLDLFQRELIDHDRFLVLEPAQQRHAGGGADGLLGQVVFVVAGLGALGGAAALTLVGPAGADAGVAGALLAEQLFGAAGHLAAAQRRVGAGPLVGQVHQDDFVQQLLVDLAAEVGRADFDGADRLAALVEDVEAEVALDFGRVRYRFAG